MFMMGGFEVIFFLMFFLVFGMIIVNIVRGIGQWNKNNQSPRLTVSAKVVAKRTDIRHTNHHHAGNDVNGMHTTSSTDYFVTFEVQSGDRMEFEMDGSEYGMLVEGDEGELAFQGTRYQGFERKL